MRFFLIAIAVFITAFPAAAAREEGIAAIVNQDAITMSELQDRVRLVTVSSGLPDNPALQSKLERQVMDGLIDEQLMLEEAKKQDLKVTDAEIDQGFAALAQQNKMTPEQFKGLIEHSGVNVGTMRRQIRAQLGWSKVITKVMRPQVTITDSDIDEYINRLSAGKGKTEYLAAEIFLPVESQAQDADAGQLAQRLVAEMRAGKAAFFKVAQQFSRAAGAAHGGDLGWMQQGQLQPEVDAALSALKKGEISDPIRSATGYHIMMLRDSRTITDESIPSRDNVMSAIGIERLDRLQKRYLMDLKSSAFIENRVQS